MKKLYHPKNFFKKKKNCQAENLFQINLAKEAVIAFSAPGCHQHRYHATL